MFIPEPCCRLRARTARPDIKTRMTLPRISFLPLVLGAALYTTLPLAAQTPPVNPPHDPRVTQIIDALGKAKTISETNLSPDGQRIVWGMSGREGSEIEVALLANPTETRQIT